MEIKIKDLHIIPALGKDMDLCRAILLVNSRHSLVDLSRYGLEVRLKSGEKKIISLEKAFLRTYEDYHFFCLVGVDRGEEVGGIIFWEIEADGAERVVGQMFLTN